MLYKFETNEDVETTTFEEEMQKQLLIEALSQQKAEVFENVVFEGNKRYYIEDLTKRDYILENTTPYQIRIEGVCIEEKSWGSLICKILELLLSKKTDKLSDIYNFRCQWSKATMITKEQKTNHKKIKQGLYVNCNHTAFHACWFIQDLLDYFYIDKPSVYFLIHSPSGAEPKEVKEYIEKRTKNKFQNYLESKYNKNREYSIKVINNIDKYLNKILKSLSKSYVNFFLFDDKNILYNYIQKVKSIIDNSKYESKSKIILNKYLNYILSFYRDK